MAGNALVVHDEVVSQFGGAGFSWYAPTDFEIPIFSGDFIP